MNSLTNHLTGAESLKLIVLSQLLWNQYSFLFTLNAARKWEQNAKDRKTLEVQDIELQTREKEHHNLLKSGGVILHEAESNLH